MLTIFKSTEHGLMQIDQPVNGCWISAVDPGNEETRQLESWGIEPELINYSLDLDEMARTERDDGYIFILLRVPYFQGLKVDIPYTTIPLGIIITDRFVVTISKYKNDIIQGLCEGKYRRLKTAKRYRFSLYIFLEAAAKYLTYLRDINKTVEILEDQLQLSTRNRELLEILKYQKSLVYFTTALKSNELMLERLQRSQLFNQYEEDRELLDDVITENQQAIEMTNINNTILSSMMDAFASIISNNMNTVVKFLAAITIILNLPVLVASFYGMNVDLPFQANPLAFGFTIVFSLALVGVAIYVFARRDWF